MILEAQRDKVLRSILERADLVVPESWGILWASRHTGDNLREFTPGIDLVTALCRLAADNGDSVYFLGARSGIAEIAAQALTRRFPGLRIAGTRDGYFRREEEATVVRGIQKAAPAILFVGMSVPAQEKWIDRHLAALKVPVVMGVGGSFDVLSGQLKRAPLWMRRAGIEWVYRTLQEPWRWRRIANLPVFMWRVLRARKRE